MSAFLVPVGRYGGRRLLTPTPPPQLSARARALGLETREDVEEEYRLQVADTGRGQTGEGWSKGTDYHCPFCDADFWSPSGARKHMQAQGHPVLRMCWYDEAGS